MNIEIKENGTFLEIKKVLRGLSHTEYQYLFSRNTFIDSPNAKIRLIALVDGKIAGFLEGYVFPESTDTIVVCLAVLAKYRGLGIAKRLVSRMESLALSLGVSYVVWRADKINTASTSLAISLGYRLVKDDGVQVRYEKQLKRGKTQMDAFEKVQLDAMMAAQEAIFFSTEKSRSKKIMNFAQIDKALSLNITMLEKWIVLTNNYMKGIPTRPNTIEAQQGPGEAYMNTSIQYDYDRGTDKELRAMSQAYVRNRRRWLDRADMKKADVQDAEKALLLKLVKGGEYRTRLETIITGLNKIAESVKAAWDKYEGMTYYMRSYNTIAHEHKWYAQQCAFTIGDTNSLLKLSAKHGFDATKYEKHDD